MDKLFLSNNFSLPKFSYINLSGKERPCKLILCELGYKVLDPKHMYYHDKYNLNIDKICFDKFKIKEKYKNLLNSYN